MTYSVRVVPSHLKGILPAPPSKSILHRAIIAAALSHGKSTLSPFCLSDDISATLNAVKAIGATYNHRDTLLHIEGTKSLHTMTSPIHVYDSGSTLRFLIPIASLSDYPVTFILGNTLSKRPHFDYQNVFGNQISFTDNTLTIHPPLTPGDYRFDTLTSSQFISGLLFALPLLEKSSTIRVKSSVSTPYITLTTDVLKSFNITIDTLDNGYSIPGNQTYKHTNITIEGDYSQAAYFLAAGLLHSTLTVNNLNTRSLQGDRSIIDFIDTLQGTISSITNGYTVERSSLQRADFNLENNPDLAPVLALLCTFAKGTSRLYNIKRLKYKESNRIASIQKALNLLGARIDVQDDAMIIHGVKRLKGGISVDSFNDHRIVMMLTIAGTLCEEPLVIKNASAVTKSYPNFFRDVALIGGNILFI